jgi:hypothetical protein
MDARAITVLMGLVIAALVTAAWLHSRKSPHRRKKVVNASFSND